MNQTTERKRKSQKLTSDERRGLNKWVSSFDTKLDAIEALAVSKPTLDRVLTKGSGHPETIRKIREKITGLAQSA